MFARVGSGGNVNEYRYIGIVDGVERERLPSCEVDRAPNYGSSLRLSGCTTRLSKLLLSGRTARLSTLRLPGRTARLLTLRLSGRKPKINLYLIIPALDYICINEC